LSLFVSSSGSRAIQMGPLATRMVVNMLANLKEHGIQVQTTPQQLNYRLALAVAVCSVGLTRCVHIHIHTHIYIYIYVCMCIYIYTYMYIYMCVCVCVCVIPMRINPRSSCWPTSRSTAYRCKLPPIKCEWTVFCEHHHTKKLELASS